MYSALSSLERRDPAEELIRASAGIMVIEGTRPMEEWQRDPIGWAVRFLAIREETLRWSLNPGYERHRWDGTPEPIVAMAEAIARWEWVGVESGTGTGKSHGLGWLALWFLACFQGARVFSYAAKEDQLELYSWTEIRKLWPRFKRLFPRAELGRALIIRMDARQEGDEAGWGAVGRAAQVRADEDVAHKAAGMHAEHMLVLAEEMAGMPRPIIRALENTCTGSHNIFAGVGNPDHQHDPLHEFCLSPNVTRIRISALDHPNIVANAHRDPTWQDWRNDRMVVPGAVSRKSIRDRARKYGEDSPIYQRRVRGIAPAQASDAVISQRWIDQAVVRWHDLDMRGELMAVGGPGLGVDVARSDDGDEAAIARGIGAVLVEVSSFPCNNPLLLGIQVALEMDVEGCDERNVGVDEIGVGGGAVDKLKELGRHVRAINAAESAPAQVDRDIVAEKGVVVLESEKYLNLRAQMWWRLRQDLLHGRVALPPDPELHRELVVPTWLPRGGKIVVEPKEDIRGRLGRSPNMADAVVMWNWVRPRPLPKNEEDEAGAWSAGVLEAEADYLRRVRNPRDILSQEIDPMMVSV